jgi:sterol desaturase/sphingolipid hydroxylase (fatty acid hydroxylase superfamily)
MFDIFQLLIPSTFFMNILIYSGLTAYGICNFLNQPFFNQQKYSLPYLEEKITAISRVGGAAIVNYNALYFGFSQFYLHNESETFYQTSISTLKYILILEFLYYVYHRLCHHKLLYKWIHAHHHSNIAVYPIDFLHIDYFDNLILITCFNFPLYFSPLSYRQFALILYVYSVCGFLIHGDIIGDRHVIHHKYFKSNYCLVFPIYDYMFSTLREK